MIKPQEIKTNQSVLCGYNIAKESSVGDLVDAVTLNKPIEDTSSAFLASNAVNRVMAFVEYGLSSDQSEPSCKNQMIWDGASEIIQMCRVVSMRVEEYLFWLSDKEMVEGWNKEEK